MSKKYLIKAVLYKAGRKDIGQLVPRIILDKNGKRMKVWVKREEAKRIPLTHPQRKDTTINASKMETNTKPYKETDPDIRDEISEFITSDKNEEEGALWDYLDEISKKYGKERIISILKNGAEDGYFSPQTLDRWLD